MAFKAASIIMAPDGDPTQHKSTIKTGTLESTTVIVPLMDFDVLAQVARDLVQNQGIQSLLLCPGCTHEAIARVREAVGPEIPINVARGDVPSTMATAQILRQEGWFPERY